MVTENAELMKMARQSLEGRWWQFIKATLVYYIVLIPIQLISLSLPITSNVISLLVGAPLALGFIIFSLNFTRKKRGQNC
tara:strand:+ start:4239 stop:4478 length:240 start_codon:yes stop_codon:yes gene_type:complete